MTKSYNVVFKLWDVTKGERTGDLVEESEAFTVSPLSKVNEVWAPWAGQAPVELKPLSDKALRVAMARNDGQGVCRRRFEYDGSKYLITIHCATVPEQWTFNGGYSIKIIADKVRLFIPGEGWVLGEKVM